ncbi:MAG: apolipoprotein N-acyltransferase [Phycisphaeraceae bacterium]|nr:MAG: apolipoprotein N-acyltransferase [Phycisphaeraceae bacterium]
MRAFFAGAVFGLLMYLANSSVGVWPIALVAAGPLVIPAALGWFDRGPRVAAGLVVLGSVWFWLAQHPFIHEITALGWVPLGVYLSLFPGVFVWVFAWASRRWPAVPSALLAPTVWVGVEVLRGEVLFGGYAWYVLAQPMIEWEGTAPLASVVGMYGVSFVLAALSGAAADLLVAGGPRRKQWEKEARRAWSRRAGGSALTAGVLLVSCAVVVGVSREPVARGTLVAAVVQTDVPQGVKMSWSPSRMVEEFRRLAELTRAGAGAGAGLIVWPETMKPGIAMDAASVRASREAGVVFTLQDGTQIPDHVFADEIEALQGELGVPMLIGEEAFEGLGFKPRPGGGLETVYRARFNSAFLIMDGRAWEARYDKMRPTPFGESIPGARSWPWLERVLAGTAAAKGMKLDLGSGRVATVFEVPWVGGEDGGGKVRAVTPICFEVTSAALCRSMVYGEGRARADLLVNLTNDGWFMGFDPGREAHLQLARWRCAELGTPMIRAANTGYSAIIDARGRVLGPEPPASEVDAGLLIGPRMTGRDGVLLGRVPLGDPGHATAYARLGNVVGWGSFWVAIVLATAGVGRWLGSWRPRS